MVEKDIKKVADHEWLQITEDQLYKFVTRSIARCFHDVIATHEAHESEFVPIPWLRDYADDLAMNFPRITPSMIRKGTNLDDKEFA